MPAIEPFGHLMALNTSSLTREENILLEFEIFTSVCHELKELFRKQHKDFFQLMRNTLEEENQMLEAMFTQLIINDILITKEYDLRGIAYYTDTFEEVIEEIVKGRNTNPSAYVFRKLIDLHRVVRRDIYNLILQKVMIRFEGKLSNPEKSRIDKVCDS